MSTSVGRFRLPPEPVSITDGRHQMEFDSPADMADYLIRHPEVAARISEFTWTRLPLSGGH
jgi:hypothetical protein